MKIIATAICGIVCLVNIAFCATQESTPLAGKKEDKKMQILEGKISELKAKTGTEWLMVSHKGKDAFVQIEQSKENGKLFAALYPRLKGILKKGDFGNMTLPQLFKVNDWVVVVPVAVLIFLLLIWLERGGL